MSKNKPCEHARHESALCIEQTPLQSEPESDTMQKTDEGTLNVRNVGTIDLEKFKAVFDDITTNEVVITKERIEHIEKNHPGDYEKYGEYIPRIIKEPDYILKANKPNSAVLLKEIVENGERFNLILRLKTSNDPEEFKNSVISFWKVDDKDWKRLIKNKRCGQTALNML